ncbi:MAG: tRNA (adenosine(37)-N6)-threonylcarbamoyltransferase complex dimerization subunit type 1 TsaB [Venatoribacter sp.]
MPTLLAVDASASLCSVALLHQGQWWHKAEEQPRRQAQRLLPMVSELLAEAGVAKSQLQGVAYGCGPGSFTGIRIAASVTHGIALGLELPVYGVSSLQALAQNVFSHSQAQQVFAIMNAHMGEVFWGQFQRQEQLCTAIAAEQVGEPSRCLEDIAQFSGELAGDGLLLSDFSLLNQTYAQTSPLALHVLELALPAWQNQQFTVAEQQLPVYLRDSVAWKKLDEQPSLLSRS